MSLLLERVEIFLLKKLGPINSYLFRLVMGCVIVGIVWGIEFNMDVQKRLFLERDPDFSYYIKGKPNFDTITPGQDVGMGLGIAYALVLIYSLIVPLTGKGTTREGLSRVQHFFLYGLALLFAILCNQTATDTLKINIARPRPSFFYICNYKGYRDAVDSGNYTKYNSATVAGAPGDYSGCIEEFYIDAILSFPSGHTSFIFVTMVFACLLIRKMFNIQTSFSLAGIASWSLLTLAAYVAVTRVQIFKHREDDVGFGAVIGAVCGAIGFHSVEIVSKRLRDLADQEMKDGPLAESVISKV